MPRVNSVSFKSVKVSFEEQSYFYFFRIADAIIKIIPTMIAEFIIFIGIRYGGIEFVAAIDSPTLTPTITTEDISQYRTGRFLNTKYNKIAIPHGIGSKR